VELPPPHQLNSSQQYQQDRHEFHPALEQHPLKNRGLVRVLIEISGLPFVDCGQRRKQGIHADDESKIDRREHQPQRLMLPAMEKINLDVEKQPCPGCDPHQIPGEHAADRAGIENREEKQGTPLPQGVKDTCGRHEEHGVDAAAGFLDQQLLTRNLDDQSREEMRDT
jgi:hypothetical protein